MFRELDPTERDLCKTALFAKVSEHLGLPVMYCLKLAPGAVMVRFRVTNCGLYDPDEYLIRH